MKIIKLLKRHHFGCFDVLTSDGETFMVQLAYRLEEAWNKEHSK